MVIVFITAIETPRNKTVVMMMEGWLGAGEGAVRKTRLGGRPEHRPPSFSQIVFCLQRLVDRAVREGSVGNGMKGVWRQNRQTLDNWFQLSHTSLPLDLSHRSDKEKHPETRIDLMAVGSWNKIFTGCCVEGWGAQSPRSFLKPCL